MHDNKDRAIPGQQFRPSARQWNRFLGAADAIEALTKRFAEDRNEERASAVDMPAVNATEDTLERFSVVRLTGWVIEPADNEVEATCTPSVLVDVPDSAARCNVGVTTEPIAAGKFGSVRVSGVVACKVEVTIPGVAYASPIDGDATKLRTDRDGAIEIIVREPGSDGTKWALVRLSGAAPVRRFGWYMPTAIAEDITGATPSWVYTLTPLNSFASGSWGASGTTVRARNFAEDQAHYQHGQGFPSGVTGTYLPVEGPVLAWDTGIVEAGVPLWAFDALNPIDPACGGG